MAKPRHVWDKDPLVKQLGDDITKLKGNSFYGETIEDFDRHKCTKFTYEERVVHKALRSLFFDDLKEMVGPMRSKSLSKML